MRTSMIRRGAGVTAAAAAMCVFLSPGVSHASESAGPIVTGDCAATLGPPESSDAAADDEAADKPTAERPVTVDPGAAVNVPGKITIGTGSESTGTADQPQPMLTVPVGDALEHTGINDTPVIGETASELCHTLQQTINEFAASGEETSQDDVPDSDAQPIGEDGQNDPTVPPQQDPTQDDAAQSETAQQHGHDESPPEPTVAEPAGAEQARAEQAAAEHAEVEPAADNTTTEDTPVVESDESQAGHTTSASPSDADSTRGTPHSAQPERTTNDPDMAVDNPAPDTTPVTSTNQHRLPLLIALTTLVVAVTLTSRRVSSRNS